MQMNPSRASATATAKTSRAVPRAARREVFERDGERCTFVSSVGQRCPARAYLEIDHIRANALGGGDETENLRVYCRAHNRLWAELTFGREHVAESIDLRQRKSRPVERTEVKPERTPYEE
jgi:5-methylcytosine-specific restriction endonuclease McrA